MEKQNKYVVPYLSRNLIYQNIHSLRDVDCLTPLRIFKIMTVGLKMDSDNAIKNYYLW